MNMNTVVIVLALCFFFVVAYKILNGWPREKDERYILGDVDGKVVKVYIRDLIVRPCSCGARWSMVPQITHNASEPSESKKCHEGYLRQFGVAVTKEELGGKVA